VVVIWPTGRGVLARVGPAGAALAAAQLALGGVTGTLHATVGEPGDRLPPAAPCPALAVRAAWALDLDGDGVAEVVLSDGRRYQVLATTSEGRYEPVGCEPDPAPGPLSR
jgi:hypothetical protein